VLSELQQIAETLGMEGHHRLRKNDLIEAILTKSATDGQGARSAPTSAPRTQTQEAAATEGSENGQAAQAVAEAPASAAVEAPARPSPTEGPERTCVACHFWTYVPFARGLPDMQGLPQANQM